MARRNPQRGQSIQSRWWKPALRRLRRWTCWPPVGSVRFGDLRGVQPISRDCAQERGTPVDAYYTERFLDEHASALSGRVHQLDGTAEADANRDPEPRAVSALDRARRAHPEGCDALVCRDLLESADDPAAMVEALHGLLRPGGVLLISLAGIGPRPGRRDARWGFTPASARRLFEASFAESRVWSFGNVRSAVACFQGIAAEELGDAALREADPDYPLILGVRAVKADGAPP